MKVVKFLETIDEADEPKLKLSVIVGMLKELHFKIYKEDELSDRKSNIKIYPQKAFYPSRRAASEALMQHAERIGFKPKFEMYQGRRPIVYFGGWKITVSLIAGEKAITAASYENAIASAWNSLHGFEDNIKVVPETKKAGIRIAKLLSNRIKGKAKAKSTGSLRVATVSKFWKDYVKGRVDSTPKTDILIGENNRISVKMGKAAQLCSSKIVESEGEALLYYALRRSGASVQLAKDIGTILDHKRLSAQAPKTKEELEHYQFEHKIVQSALRNVMNSNDAFKKAFVREIMTGEGKFEDVAIDPIANFMLAASFDGDKISYHSITDEYVDKIKDQVFIYVNFKTSGSSKYSALRATQKNLLSANDMGPHDIITEAYLIEFAKDHDVYLDLSIEEGLKEPIERMFNYLKLIAQKGYDLLLKVLHINVNVTFTYKNIDFF